MSAAVQRELDRRSYATTGDGPHRQSLYDWAVTGAPPRDTADGISSDDSDGEMEAMSTAAPNADPGARRDLQRLERALQSYRSARNALRTSRAGGSDLGAVPTASALRAYWNEDDDENTTRPPRIGAFAERYRREPVPAHAQSARALVEPRFVGTPAPKRTDAFMRVRKLVRYLSELRDTGVEGGLEAARQLGLDSLYASHDSITPSDLPMHINSLPIPQYSSWLQPGMTWHGLQSTEREPVRSSAVLASSLRRERQRELFRRTLARRREMTRGVGGDDFAQPSADTLLDAERYLSDLLQDSNGRWSFPQRSTTSLSSHPPQAPASAESDRWPVKVTINTIDWDAMTVTGMMSASHMPDKMSSVHQSSSTPEAAASSMSSFFTGEIIDFRRQPLETEKEGRDYEVGGLDVDARYWQRLGPFKREIDRVRHLRGKRRSEYQQHSPLWDAFRKAAGQETENKDPQSTTDSPAASSGSGTLEDHQKIFETNEDKEIEADQIMARCLGSTRWLEEKLGSEWILMRWKERCFVTPPGNSTNSNSTRTILTTSTSAGGTFSGRAGSNGSTSWGLTISGFYYIALNRLTGEIDGLYYDPGSQPYQALKMTPESMQKDEGNACVCGCGERDCREPVGIKKWFPSIEFR
ncbi:hypothetical protein H2200_007451 [Cladophialophora chaetospira]|uniref:Post-SET domain-containing protein n=1 Tax=Cladophialophora chaetospira TaxID=386627 RepID=A0AA38X7Z6_9EURO|nr:hypothetical protein H2200_007451 [Cladophialophora chaetospira]